MIARINCWWKFLQGRERRERVPFAIKSLLKPPSFKERGVPVAHPPFPASPRGSNRLLVGIGRTLSRRAPARAALREADTPMLRGKCCPSFARCCRSLHHGSQARLRTFPDWLGDRGDVFAPVPGRPAGKPSTDHAAPAHTHKEQACQRCDRGFL